MNPIKLHTKNNTITGVKMEYFSAPDDKKFLTIRSVVYDSWIIWNDALPFDPQLRKHLNQDIYTNIVDLATRIHKLHQSMPGYKSLCESPFEFILWFDPQDDDPKWNQGKLCRFKINEFTAEEIAYYNTLKKGNKLSIKPMTTMMVEAQIPE